MTEPTYDIIIFGATSFVGKITVRHMAQTFGSAGELSWAIAGRSADKLDAIRHEAQTLDANQQGPKVLIADSNDDESLRAMCAQTRVVVSTVGPFANYGEPLVKACVESGTDYCDITGEVHWVLAMISRYQEQAVATGARIVHCCGFDSIPSDLGVYFTHRHAEQNFGQACDEINMRVSKLRGSLSGGTYASLMNAVKEIAAQPALRRAVVNPYCLCPSDHPFTTRQRKHSGADFDALTQSWMTPFIMEGINTRIVHRSNSLFDNDYGENFRYDEALLTGKGRKGRKRATRMSLLLKLLMISAAIPPLAAILNRFLLPKPGEGPSQQAQDEGNYQLLFIGTVRGRGSLRCTVTGDRDPGYGSTAKILAQAAACLAKDIPKEQPGGGFWTPARIFSDRLIERLNKHAGLCFEVTEIDKSS